MIGTQAREQTQCQNSTKAGGELLHVSLPQYKCRESEIQGAGEGLTQDKGYAGLLKGLSWKYINFICISDKLYPSYTLFLRDSST